MSEARRTIVVRAIARAWVDERWTLEVPAELTGAELHDYVADHFDPEAEFQTQDVRDEEDRDITHIDDRPVADYFTNDEPADDQRKRLARLEAEFAAAGGRGIELAEEIDALREAAAAALERVGIQLAHEHFTRLGYTTIERQARTRHGAIDLIVSMGGTLVFCEVKVSREAPHVGGAQPYDAKRSQVRRMGASWMNDHSGRRHYDELRFDAVQVSVDAEDRLVSLGHIEGAF